MGIASRQLAWAMDKALDRILKAGRLPSLRELFAAIPAVLGPSGPGFPLLRLRPARSHRVASPEDLTAMIRELRTDLELLFAEHHAQAQDILAAYDWTETEHRALARRLWELEETLDRMLLLNQRAAGYVASAGDRFASLQRVDTSRTTAWVDLAHHRVSPPIRRGVSREIPLDGATLSVEIVAPDASTQVPELTQPLSEPAQALDGRLDTAWIQQVVTTQTGPCTVRFAADLGQGRLSDAPVSEIAVAPHALPGSTVQVFITEDGTLWRSAGSQAYRAEVELAFPVGRPIRACRIELTQAEHDNMLPSFDPELQGTEKPVEVTTEDGVTRTETVTEITPVDERATFDPESGKVSARGEVPARYEYHLGLKTLSWRAVFYETSGVLYSTALTPTDSTGRPSPIGQVSLQAEETLHSGDIRYAISADQATWIPIVPLHRAASSEESVIDFRSVSSPQQVGAQAGITDTTRKVSYQGLDFWRLTTLAIPTGYVLVPDSVQVLAGYRQAGVYQYVYDWGGTTPDPWEGVPDPSLVHWVQLPGGLRFSDDVTLRFRDLSTTQLSIPHTQPHTHTRLVARLRLAKSQEVTLYAKLVSGVSELAASWYVDRNRAGTARLTPNNPWRLTVSLFEGTNTLQLLLYSPHTAPDGQLTLLLGVEQDGTVRPLLELDRDLVGADFTPQAVAPFDLFYRTPEKVYDRYAADPADSSIYIPDVANQMGIHYLLRYRYRRQDIPTTLYLKAEFEKPQAALLPPFLHAYTLMVTP